MGGEHIEIDLNIIPSPRVFYFVHPDLIVVLRFCDLCVHGSASRETSMISRRIGWTGAGGLWGFKFLVLSMALLVVMGAGQKLAAADRPRPTWHREEQERGARWFHRPAAGKFLEESGCESCETGDRRGILETSLP